jgi:hypothetical protein
MLADSCQAAVQSMAAPTPGQIEGMVREVIKGKFDEGQLSNCALTFRDLDIIASTFATILAGAKHYRMPYPEQLAKELAKVKKQALEEIAKENKETNKETEKDSKDSKDFKESKENGERSADKSEKK